METSYRMLPPEIEEERLSGMAKLSSFALAGGEGDATDHHQKQSEHQTASLL